MMVLSIVDGINQFTYEFLLNAGLGVDWAKILNVLLLLSCTLIIAWLLDKTANVILTQTLLKFKNHKFGNFFAALVNNKVVRKVSHLIPLIIFTNAVYVILAQFPSSVKVATILINVWFIILIIGILKRIFRSVIDIAETKPGLKDKPLESYQQVISIILTIIAFILVFAQVTGREVWAVFTAMGAMSAILLLVFKDTIMGFVASIQVTTNDMVRIGDWIEMPKYGADGDVIEITLTTVKVQNFDKTITTIPTYSLISDSFRNWRGMQDTGGRRIKRSINLKMSTVHFLTDEEIKELRKIALIAQIIDEKKIDIDQYNADTKADKSVLINGRNLTNAGLFRYYILAYLQNNKKIHNNLTMIVRQLAPTEHGMPMEIYTFTNTTNWVQYEGIMADVFDHVIAAAPYFKLEIFESPAGGDFRPLKQG